MEIIFKTDTSTAVIINGEEWVINHPVENLLRTLKDLSE
jgi:hypothetical protein